MGKRKKSTKGNKTTVKQDEQSEDIHLKTTENITPFLAIHQNNLLESIDSAPEIAEEDINTNHHHHESKLLETISVGY